ncbi:MAG: C39 family peptidase [Clostridiales bacterium]|nr:C39 family peptidase [Clostridiales bacterium]
MQSSISGKRKQTMRKKKRYRYRKKLAILIRLGIFCVIIGCGIHFLESITGRNWSDAGNETWQKYAPAGYIDEKDASLMAPVRRTGSELRKKLESLAETDRAYAEIYANYDAYPEELLSALCSNPEMLSYVQGYLDAEPSASGGFTRAEKEEKLPLLVQWDKRWGYAPYGDSTIALSGCAPTCLSMVVLSLTGNADATPDAVADYAQKAGYYQAGTGTSWNLMTEGCENFGIHGSEISLSESVIRAHLEAGEPVICSMRPGDFTSTGHFIVLVGEQDGKIMVNDPNSRVRSRVLWDYETLEPQIKNLWAFSN